jgi:hypothetical protein
LAISVDNICQEKYSQIKMRNSSIPTNIGLDYQFIFDKDKSISYVLAKRFVDEGVSQLV